MNCPKCENAMSGTSNLGVRSYICFFCGYVHYPAYPLRPAPKNICDVCGEEFKPHKNYLQKYCPKCKKLIGKNYSKLKQEMESAYA